MYRSQHAGQPVGAPEAVLGTAGYVADERAALRLSRATALARWRSPAGLAFIAVIPLILIARRIVDVVVGASHSDSWVLDLVGMYFGLLAVTVVIAALLTVVAMVRSNRYVLAYASAGATMTARYQRDSLELGLVTGTSVIAYGQIQELFGIGDSVFLRVRGMRGIALPRELFPEPSLQLMGRRLPTPAQGRRTTVIASAAAGALVAVAAGVGALSLVYHGDRSAIPSVRATIPLERGHADTLTVYGDTAYVVDNGMNDGAVEIVDIPTRKVTATIPVSDSAAGVALDPAARKLYVANGGGRNRDLGRISVIDTGSRTVTTTIPFPRGVWRMTIDTAAHRLYAVVFDTNSEDDKIVVIDTTSDSVVGEVPVPETARDIVIDPGTHLAYVGFERDVPIHVIDTVNLKVTATIPFGARVRGLALDPKTHTLYAVGEEQALGPMDVLKIIDTMTATTRTTVPTAQTLRGIIVDPGSHSLYALALEFGAGTKPDEATVRVFDAGTGVAAGSVTLATGSVAGRYPDVNLDPVTHRIYALNEGQIDILSR